MINQAGEGLKAAINERINPFTISKGIFISYIVTIPVFLVFAFVLTYTAFPEKYISTVVVITTIISILIAGSTSTRNLRSRGWLNGAFVGFIYMFVLFLASSIAYRNFSVNGQVISMVFIGILAGAIGGIAGINFKRSSHSKFKTVKR